MNHISPFYADVITYSCHNLDAGFVNSLRPGQNGCHFANGMFKCISLNENVWILIKISLKFVPRGPVNNIPALVQIMAWRLQGGKPLSEPMMVSLLTHICTNDPTRHRKWGTTRRQVLTMVSMIVVMLHKSGPDKMAAIWQTIFLNAFSWKKKYEFLSRFHWSLFQSIQRTIWQHCFA